ncbi:MAG: hypothetical protein Q7J57_14940 [Gemmobacter sp.]|nr:hypothetical protein [Gemmobacter sp.]
MKGDWHGLKRQGRRTLTPCAAETFAGMAQALDWLAARKVAGCATLQCEIEALLAAIESGGDSGGIKVQGPRNSMHRAC